MSDSSSSPLQIIQEGAHLVRSRELELGHPSEDGPSASQVDHLLGLLTSLLTGQEDRTPSEIWEVFRAATVIKATWLFPERDPIAGLTIPALESLQESFGNILDATLPEHREQLDHFANLAAAQNLLNRKIAASGNGFTWRIFVAQCMSKIGLRTWAISLANQEFERWRESGK